ncbi:MAG TPA: hypothetical protein VGA37_13560 [Gemmatimonadales bacterium]
MPPNVAGTWTITASNSATIRQTDVALQSVISDGAATCNINGWKVVLTQDSLNVAADFSGRSLVCDGEDLSAATPTDGSFRLSETLAGFSVPGSFNGAGQLTFAPRNVCTEDPSFAVDQVTQCSFSEILKGEIVAGRLSGTYSIRFEYTFLSSKKLYLVQAGTWTAKR